MLQFLKPIVRVREVPSYAVSRRNGFVNTAQLEQLVNEHGVGENIEGEKSNAAR